MAELKPGWQRVKFGELAECINDRVDDPATAGVNRYVGLEHLDPDSLTIRRWGSPSDVESTKLRFQPGDIIFGKRRAYQRKLAIADFEGICSAHAMVLRARPKAALPEFLPFFMQSDLFMKRAIEISVGSLSPTINWKTLAKEEFDFPSLDRQVELSKLLAKVSALLQSLLKARDAKESVDNSLWEGLALAAEDDKIALSDIAHVITGFAFKSSEFVDHGIQAIRISNLYGGAFNAGRDPIYLPSHYAVTYEQFTTRPGDILISMTGATKAKSIGWPVLLPGPDSEYLVNQRVAVVRPKEPIIREWLFMNMKSGAFQSQLSTGITATAQANLSTKTLKSTRLPRPSDSTLSLAQEIWHKSEAASRNLEKSINKARMMLANLMSTFEAPKEP